MTRRSERPARRTTISSSSPRVSRSRFGNKHVVLALVVAALVVIIVALVITVSSAQRWVFGALAAPPATGTVIVAPTSSKARVALETDGMDAEQRSATEYLAEQPTAYWLTPEQDPLGRAGRTVSHLTTAARDEGVALAVVIYGLPGRDCGNHSAGGLSEREYQAWIDDIATALSAAPDLQKIVVLEPDSLALAPECADIDERAEQLRDAVDRLQSPGTWIYLDGGHSAWLAPTEMADLIDLVDVGGKVRGFATNVSNYQSTHEEFAYAHAVAARLDGMHAIVDTSRNGAASAGTEWCNPAGQRIGDAGGTYGDDVVDTNLWIKPPGESDGPCQGGPDAGVWWPEAAATLTTDAR
ncbi:glycoside hydrolase family 6 protein [Microbacterium sp. NPDC089987]|uniref:glycoside hydrolase family 6 protein n=1 Tax=Microbacterium sp. NPDC089987 TaxID=3364202 RepID=UPI00382F5386